MSANNAPNIEIEATGTPIAALPAPSDASDAQKIDLGSEKITALEFDALGPMVVNSDATLSRITNWENMTELERIRVLNARNRLRLSNELEKQGSDHSGEAVNLAK